jgi:hypothetical protein
MRRFLFALTVGLGPLLLSPPPIEAQSIGTFQWQVVPFCNVLTVNVSSDGPDSFSATGWDDGCGAPLRDGLYGTFFFNPGFDPSGDNNIGGGLTVVNAGGTPWHIDVLINEFTLVGTWRGSDGTTGQLIP